MVEYEQHLFVTRAAPRVLPLAAAAATVVLVALFLWIPVAGAAAAEQQQRILFGNTTTYNVDGNFRIAHAQPQLEGFDKMASDLGSALAVLGQLTTLNPGDVSKGTQVQGKADCGRDGRDKPYRSCTTDPNKGDLRKCDPLKRDC